MKNDQEILKSHHFQWQKKASWGQPNKEYRGLFCRKMETSSIWHKRRDYCVYGWDFLLLQGSRVSQIHVGIICNPD